MHQAGELCKDCLGLYNSTTNLGLNTKLCQVFENDKMGEVVFSKGVSTNSWAGNFGKVCKSNPGAFSPFSFSKMQPLSTNNDKVMSLLINIYSGQKGGLMRNLDDVKVIAKTMVSVLQDYHLFVFQVKAYALASKYIFGVDSFLARQLFLFIETIKHHIIAYKNRFALEENIAATILWAINKSVNLFLKECRRCYDHKNVNGRYIHFDDLHMNILLSCFKINLPSNFYKAITEPAPGKENDHMSNKKKEEKQKGKGNDDGGSKRENNKLVNNNQVPEFKIMDGEMWEKTFQGNCIDKGVKWSGTFM